VKNPISSDLNDVVGVGTMDVRTGEFTDLGEGQGQAVMLKNSGDTDGWLKSRLCRVV